MLKFFGLASWVHVWMLGQPRGPYSTLDVKSPLSLPFSEYHKYYLKNEDMGNKSPSRKLRFHFAEPSTPFIS